MATYLRTIKQPDGETLTVQVEATRVESRCLMDVSVKQSFGWVVQKQQAEVGEWYCNDGLCRYLMPASVFASFYRPYHEGVSAH